MSKAWKSINSNAIVDLDFGVYLINAANNSVTATLPTIADTDIAEIRFKRFDVGGLGTNLVTIAAAVGQTIDGNATTTLIVKQAIIVQCSGGAWYIMCGT